MTPPLLVRSTYPGQKKKRAEQVHDSPKTFQRTIDVNAPPQLSRRLGYRYVLHPTFYMHIHPNTTLTSALSKKSLTGI